MLPHIDGTVFTHALLDAFFSTVIYCFYDDIVKKVCGHGQKLSYKNFSSVSLTAVIQRIRTAITFVHQRCPEKLEVLCIEIHASEAFAPLSLFCKATVKLFLSPLKERLIAVSSKWSGQCVTTEISTIHDRYIAEYDESNKQMKLLEFLFGNDAQSGRGSNDVQH